MSMKWKIIIPMSCVMTVLVITMLVSSTIRFTEYTSILFNERITVSTNGLKSFLIDSRRNTRIAAVSASINTDVIAAINNRDKDKIIRILLNSMDLYHVDFFTVTDGEGIVVARTHAQESYGDSVSDQKNIHEALNNNIYSTIEEGAEVRFAIRTGAPILNDTGKIIGVISAGVRLDTNEGLDLLKDHYDADFSVFMNDIRIATTVLFEGERIIGSMIDQDAAKYIYTNKSEYFGTVDVFGENYSVYYLPLLDEHNEIFAIIGVANSNSKLIAAKNTLQTSVVIIGISGLIISIIILLLISSRIVRPVKRLENLVSEVTRGNMDVNINRTGVEKDEIGLLTEDIYSLVDVIRLILSDLSNLTIDLGSFSSIEHQINTKKYSGSYREIVDGIKKMADSISSMKKTMAIMDHLDTMISVSDFNYNLLYINQHMADTFKIDRENCIGKKCYKAIRNLDQPCPVCQMKKILPGTGAPSLIDYDNLYDETSGIYIGGRAAVIRWIDGADVYCNSIKNETLKIEYQKQLRNAMTAAEEASVAKSRFLANMSHEIRTPMNSIIGFSDLALDHEMTQETREYISMIKENTKWLLQIVNDILDISKVESGNIELEHIPFDIRELLISCKSVVLLRAAEKKINLQFNIDSAISKMLLGDPSRLRQVLINLLSNAVKFTDSGSVNLSVSVKNETESKTTMRFVVNDSGIGMTTDQIIRIFEPFMQADVSTTRKYGGTGLGMSIIKKTLDLMNSKLEIESEVGKGTTMSFDLTLDIADTADIKRITNKTANTVKELNKPRFEGEILVCEDNQMNQRVIIEHLKRVGLSVEIAENGKEGVDKVRSRMTAGIKPFDLIFMDIHMPVMDGMEATSKIVEMDTGTPIVAMTANIMAGDRELYKNAGMINYVGKPFTPQELWRCLLKFLKPVSFSNEKEGENGNIKLQTDLKTDFIKDNKTRFEQIKSAIDTGDIKTAHRFVHSLKNSAALINKTALRKAAEEMEAALKNEENRTTEAQMDTLRRELSAALDELVLSLQKTPPTSRPILSAVFDPEKARELIEKLEPLLKTGNPECLKLIDDLRVIPKSDEVVQQIEDFYFDAAAKALVDLKKNLEKM